MDEDFTYQTAAVDSTLDLIDQGAGRIIQAAPCGAGKSRVMRRLVERFNAMGFPGVLYTNRKLLIDQLVSEFVDNRIPHGVRAADHEENLGALFQISSLQTEDARVLKRGTWKLHDARYVLVDEPHLQKGRVARAILEAHIARGASYVGFDATPVGLSGLYQTLRQMCVSSECRQVGAIVPAYHYGPDEPDWLAFLRARQKAKDRSIRDGVDMSPADTRKCIMTPGIFGRMWEWFEKLNPKHFPTICFAADVGSSRWIAKKFSERGVPAAHMDADDIWFNGEEHESSPDMRDFIIEQWRKGNICVVSNRFLLREAVDFPWVRHVIAATIFGSIVTFLQSLCRGGRADRYADTNALWGPKGHFTIQDHGGNWWRHGSVNADYHWKLDDNAVSVYASRAERLRDGTEVEPRRCPACGQIVSRAKCPCGHTFNEKVTRPVVSTSGELRMMTGHVFPKRRISSIDQGPALWARMYFRASRAKKWNPSFRVAMALFAKENKGFYPNETWPLMPKLKGDWHVKVKDLPRSALHGYCESCSWVPCRCGQYAAAQPRPPEALGLFDAGIAEG